MPTPQPPTPQKRLRLPQTLASAIVGLFILGVLAVMPGAWALPDQTPDSQTVPTLTPTPTRPSGGGTATDTPPPGVPPTDTPPPGATATPTPPPGSTATSTSTPGPSATPTPTRTRAAPGPAAPGQTDASLCWTVPTPGFVPESASSLRGRIASEQFLVVPGQTITQRLLVENTGAVALSEVVICNPLNPDLTPGQPTTTQGTARIEPEGLRVELGELAAGQSAQVELALRIPADYLLGDVIESQAWLFAAEQRASTELLTWALPPAYLPPTGR